MHDVADLILHEDNHLLFAFKPARMLTQGDVTGDESLLDALKRHIKLRDGKPGNVFLGLVHRLDRPVAGVVVFAKTSKAASRLSEQFRMRSVEKIYWAVVERTLEATTATLQHYVAVAGSTVKVFDEPADGRKEARLTYRRLRSIGGYGLIEVILETGRKHQIRAQLAHIGHPIVGDQRYGDGGGRRTLLLVGKRLEVTHPTRPDERIWVEVPESRCPIEMWLRERASSGS